MKSNPNRLIIVLISLLCTSSVHAKTLSPLDFGLLKAHTGEERFEVLYTTHSVAVERHCGVSYKGIQRIEIEVPKSAKSIPLSYFTDFADVEITVKNKNKSISLFVLTQELQKIDVSKEDLINKAFRGYSVLNTGNKLLVIEDKTPWVKNRSGYSFGATRKDILLLKKGVAENDVIASYQNSTSMPLFYYCSVYKKRSIIKNLEFVRSADSDHITTLFNISNQNNVLIQNVSVTTPPETGLYGDAIIYFENCTKITLEDIIVNGTYSTSDKYGYAISMNNVWNSHFIRLKAHGDWGIFGNNNLNHAVLDDCDINRFDIHCYGRDVYSFGTVFRDKYNQFSSLFGDLYFENCQFIDSIPVLFEPSYSAYTPFSLEIKRCIIKCREGKPYLINAGFLEPSSIEAREELRKVSWPNIKLDNVDVLLPSGNNELTLFQVLGESNVAVDFIDRISLKAVRIDSGTKTEPKIRLSNKKARTNKTIKVSISDSSVDSVEL